MTPSDNKRQSHLIKELLENSHAWGRLQEPASDDQAEEIRIFKSDVATVFQQVMYATFTAQEQIRTLEENSVQANSTLEAFKAELDEKHQLLVDKLFDSEDGTFAKMRQYVDTKIGKVNATGMSILLIIISALAYQLLSGSPHS